MKRSLHLSAALLLSAVAAGCVETGEADVLEDEGAEAELASTEQAATDPNFRIYNIVEKVLPAGNYDGIPGNECVALLNPEYRLRKIILVETPSSGGACALSAYSAGSALSLTWGATLAYTTTAGIAPLRTALNDNDGAVHRLNGPVKNEAVALASLQSFLTQTPSQQATVLGSLPATRVHSIYDFEGQEEIYAEAAYQGVRITQTCENPGTPRLEARVNANGYVYGYTASNSGSCHSGWFSMYRVYNRNWTLVYQYDYSE